MCEYCESKYTSKGGLVKNNAKFLVTALCVLSFIGIIKLLFFALGLEECVDYICRQAVTIFIGYKVTLWILDDSFKGEQE